MHRSRRSPVQPTRLARLAFGRHAVVAWAAVVLAATWIAASIGGPYGIERRWGRAVYDLPGPIRTALEVVMQAGARGAIVAACVVLVVLRRGREALAVGIAGAVAWFAAHAGKDIVERPRPGAGSLGRPVREAVTSPGFPSAHAAVAAAIGVALVCAVRPSRGLVLLIVAAMLATAAGRMAVGAHWLLDVLGGTAIGVIAGVVAVRATDALLARARR